MTVKHRAYRLGLTGGVGSGKSTAAAFLKELGARVVDADAISRELTVSGGEAIPAIREQFGDDVIDSSGALDRAKMGEIVFGDAAARRALEGILHPMVQRCMIEEMEAADEAGVEVVVLDVPLLFETGMDVLCDAVWVMTLDPEQQVLRVMNRDRLTRAQATLRIHSQMPTNEKVARADRVIATGRPIQAVRGELERLYREITRRRQ